MKIKFIKIYFLEKKIITTEEDPKPTFYNKGFVFIELITSDGISGLGEPSPYIESPKKLQNYINMSLSNTNAEKCVYLQGCYFIC